jgi:hypothetical protein
MYLHFPLISFLELCHSCSSIYFILASLELIAEEIEDPFAWMLMIYLHIKLLRT